MKDWFQGYRSAFLLSGEQKQFLRYFTEKEFESFLGESFLLIRSRKLHIYEAMLTTEHFILTGEKKHFFVDYLHK